MTSNPLFIRTTSPSGLQCPQSSGSGRAELSLNQPGGLCICRTRGANRGYSGYVGEHYEEGECLWPDRTGLQERVARIFVLHRVTADQTEALRQWSAVGVLAMPGIVGLWEAWRCQWAAAENTQSFRNHWQVYRGLVPADSAFSDLKWRESFLSLKSLLHPTVQRSKTIRHHSQPDTKEQNTDYI